MKKWENTSLCLTFNHCRECRDKEGHRWWREQVAKRYEVPQGEVDFECPYGAKWGHGQPRGLGEVMAKIAKWMRIKECGGCRKRRGWLNRLTSRP
jgi:hypothetical protein